MTLPLLVSVPHAGTEMPPEVAGHAVLSREEVIRDGDEQAADIYLPLEAAVAAFVTTPVARAFVDANRAPDDFTTDGVVKTHTCWQVPVYTGTLPQDIVEVLLEKYYRPYHARLTELASSPIRVGVDCHTMAATAPPIAPDPGSTRPAACVSNGDGTCPDAWAAALAECLARRLRGAVRVNDPFRGGFITRTHAAEMPWLQLELSRGDFMSIEDKREAVREALTEWCARVFD